MSEELKTEVHRDRGGLCFRCENRAAFFETGRRPRCECGDINSSKYSCYCFQPVKPPILARNANDNRPMFGGWMFSARSHRIDLPTRTNMVIDAHKIRVGNKRACYIPYWKPVGKYQKAPKIEE